MPLCRGALLKGFVRDLGGLILVATAPSWVAVYSLHQYRT
ncbi:MAG: hypothetical protein ACI89A_000562, partial [Porticoccaceae bacterium]